MGITLCTHAHVCVFVHINWGLEQLSLYSDWATV
jgi:hypothetical protein